MNKMMRKGCKTRRYKYPCAYRDSNEIPLFFLLNETHDMAISFPYIVLRDLAQFIQVTFTQKQDGLKMNIHVYIYKNSGCKQNLKFKYNWLKSFKF